MGFWWVTSLTNRLICAVVVSMDTKTPGACAHARATHIWHLDCELVYALVWVLIVVQRQGSNKERH